MLEQIRNKINRLKEAKAWLQTHLNADEMSFKQLFSDVLEMINEKKQEEVVAVQPIPVQVTPTQYVKTAPTSSFVNFE